MKIIQGGEGMIRQYSLRELRARKNETQEDVARAVGVATQTYNIWEKNGIENISYKKVEKLADHFNVKMDEIKIFFTE